MNRPPASFTATMEKALNQRNAALGDMTRAVASAAVVPVMAGVVQYLFSKKNAKAEIEAMKDSYKQMRGLSPEIKDSPNQASERFYELCAIAPTIAKNPKMAAKVIEPRLQTGFSVDDIHKLTMIHAHARSSVFDSNPTAAGTAMAGLVADRMFTTFGPRVMDRIQHDMDQARDAYAQIGDLMKKHSSPQVSEECVAEMLADRYLLWKEASASSLSAAKKLMGQGAGGATLRAGASQFGKGLAFFAAPLALAGLAHAAGAIMDERKKRQIEAEADAAFAKVKKDSEAIKANPALAVEAFDALKTFAPALAVKPLVLKTFVEHTISAERLAPQTINDLAAAQGNSNRAKAPGFAHGFFSSMSPVLSTAKTITDKGSDD